MMVVIVLRSLLSFSSASFRGSEGENVLTGGEQTLRCLLPMNLQNPTYHYGTQLNTIFDSSQGYVYCTWRIGFSRIFLFLSFLSPHTRRRTTMMAMDIIRITIKRILIIHYNSLQYTKCWLEDMFSSVASNFLRHGATRSTQAATRLTAMMPRATTASFSSGSHDDFAPQRKAVDGEDEALKLIKEHVEGNPVMLYMKGNPSMPMCE